MIGPSETIQISLDAGILQWLIVPLVVAVWHVATTYTNLRYMRRNMVTRKDLEIREFKQEQKYDNKYVSREACRMMIRAEKANGAFSAGASGD